jgi:hypothetical protein
MPALGLKLRLNKITAKIAQIVTSGLVMWHKFTPIPYDGTTNRLPDSSPEGNSAKMYTGTGLSFDGSNDSVTIGDTNQNVKSVVFYVYADTTTEDFMQLQAAGAVGIGVASGTLTTTGWTSPTTYVNGASGSTITASTWRHIAVTSATAIDASDVKLGLSNASYFDGSLANVKFFSVELTANQVAELYANPEQIVPTGVGINDLVGWWYMAEGLGNGLMDGSGNNNVGIISGATYINALPSPVTQLGLLGGSAPKYFLLSSVQLSNIDITGNFSVSFWGVTVNFGNWVIYALSWVAPDGTARGLTANSGGNLVFRYENSSTGTFITSSNYLNNGDINFITATWDGTTAKIYVNGILASGSTSANTVTYTRDAYIGRVATSSVTSSNSIIYKVGLYQEALTQEQVEELYNAGIGASWLTESASEDLVNYWENKGNTDADWLDLKGVNNGTILGTPGTIWLPQGKEIGKDVVGMAQKYVNTGQLLTYNPSQSTIIQDDATIDFTSDFTIEVWANPINIASKFILYKNNAYHLYVVSTRRLQVWLYRSGSASLFTSTGSIPLNQYTCINVTYDNNDLNIYFNGQLDYTVATTGAIDIASSDIQIPRQFADNYDGFLDSVKLYNTALTADQVLQNYNAEKYKYI